MSASITCPNCRHQIEPNEAIRNEIQESLRLQMLDWQSKKEIETQKIIQLKEAEYNAKLNETKKTIALEIEKSVSIDYENKLHLLEKFAKENENKLKEARKNEIAFLDLKQKYTIQKEEQDLAIKKALITERERLREDFLKEQKEKDNLQISDLQMLLKEKDKQLEDQKKLAEEQVRKAQQGSMQLQGEVQELALEDLLRKTFPFDLISEVAKGVRGADCLQTVRNNVGQICGTIIFESKRTKEFSNDWIDKLKKDQAACKADLAIIVSHALPKDLNQFGEKDGVYICNFQEVGSLVQVLRQAILRVYDAKKSQDNKGEKMVMLYDYLTGNEFMQQWFAMRESFQRLKESLQKERDDFERNWKKKEKLIEGIRLHSLQISGSIEGISGLDAMDWNTVAPTDQNLLE